MDSTIENMINSIDLSAPVPEYEPMRQYYYLKACRQIVKEKENELNRPLKAVDFNIWMPDECKRLREASWNTQGYRLC